MDKFLNYFASNPLVDQATQDNEEPNPGYLYSEINKLTYGGRESCEKLYMALKRKFSGGVNVQVKALTVIKYLVQFGHENFHDLMIENMDDFKTFTVSLENREVQLASREKALAVLSAINERRHDAVPNPTISKLKSIEGPLTQKTEDNSKNSFFSDILKPFQSLGTATPLVSPNTEEPEPIATTFKPAIVTVSLGISEKGANWIPDYHQKSNRTVVQEFCSILPNNPVILPTRKQITDFMSTITPETDLSLIFYDISTQLQHTNWKNRLRALCLIYEFLISNAPGCQQYFLSGEGQTALMSLSGSVQKTIKDKLHAVLAILNASDTDPLYSTLFDGLEIKEDQDNLNYESSLFSGLTLDSQHESTSTRIPQNTLSTNSSVDITPKSDLNILEQIFPEVESSLYSFINSDINTEIISNTTINTNNINSNININTNSLSNTNINSNNNPITNINSNTNINTPQSYPQPFITPTISHTSQYSQTTDLFRQPVVPTTDGEEYRNQTHPTNLFTPQPPTNPLSYPQANQYPPLQPFYFTQTQPSQPTQTVPPQPNTQLSNPQRNPTPTNEGLFKVDWGTSTNAPAKEDPFDFVKIQKKI